MTARNAEALAHVADEAIRHGHTVTAVWRSGEIVHVVPDVAYIEMVVNHGEPADTYRLTRDDGRTVYLFRGER